MFWENKICGQLGHSAPLVTPLLPEVMPKSLGGASKGKVEAKFKVGHALVTLPVIEMSSTLPLLWREMTSWARKTIPGKWLIPFGRKYMYNWNSFFIK